MTATSRPSPNPPVVPASSFSPLQLLRDDRVLQIIGQIIFALILIAALYALATSILNALASRNLTPNLAFFGDRAGFDIGEKPAWYSANSTYWEAYTVGFANTMRVTIAGLTLSTLLGVFVGILLLSGNWLVRVLLLGFVEVIRNTPLIVQLFVWYFVVMLSLPVFQQSISLPPEGINVIPLRYALYGLLALFVWGRVRAVTPQQHSRRRIWVYGAITLVGALEVLIRAGILNGGAVLRVEVRPWVFLNIRGFGFPAIITTSRFAEWFAFVAVGAALALIIWVYYGRLKETTGIPRPRVLHGAIALVGAALIGWAVVSGEPTATSVPVTDANGAVALVPIDTAREQGAISQADEALYTAAPLIFQLPEKNNFRYTSGTQINPEYMALLLGLVVYTAAFIAEIVRAGILAVPKGQVEAARALGLSTGDVLRSVILPQALRVIIPPLGNQYLNLAKNSSLAIAIAYADLFQITTTIMNQSGQSVTGMALVMLTYLIISLTIATLMNRANRRFQLVTR